MVASTLSLHKLRPSAAGARIAVACLAAGILLGLSSVSVCTAMPAQPDSANDDAEASDAADPFESITPKTGASAASTELSVVTAADPFEALPAVYDPFDSAAAIDAVAYFPERPTVKPQHELVFVQATTDSPASARDADGSQDAKTSTATDPCSRDAEKPLGQLGIDIMLPAGLLPKDYAAACWAERNAIGGPFPAMRCWPVLSYFWDAPCLCYRPLYFEEINLERHGYGCCACIQPAISAAHFFGTVPCLPYCMAEHCPCECEYTLGHYRPGSCPPWRHHWPSCKPIAAATEAGVMTGLIFAIP